MALSGSFYTNVGSGWRLQLEWTATQNISANTSTVTAKLYWMSLGSSYTVSSSATKDGAIIVDGSTSTFSGSGLASLSGNQKKLLHTYSKTITHASDGKGDVTLDGYFDAEVTLSGTYYSRINLTEKTFTLDTIPRASSLTSSSQASWTAGSDTTFGISRASSSFYHKIKISVDGVLIKTISCGTSTSVSSGFSTAENTTIFTELAQGSSKGTSIVLETYSSSSYSTLIGSKTYTGTCTAPTSSTTTFADFNIGATVSGTITSKDSEFKHTVQLIFGATTYTVGTAKALPSGAWSWDSSTKASELYGMTPDSNTLAGKIRIYTYYNGVQVRSYNESTINAKVTNSNPIFAGTGLTYKDGNSVTVAVTGNDSIIVQGKSKVDVTLPVTDKATAQNGAAIESYIATLTGASSQVTKTYSTTADIVFNMGELSVGTNATLSVKAVDSRGNTTEVKKTVTVVPYSVPVLSTKSAKRKNNFEADTILKLAGSISPVTVGGVQKNAVVFVQYRTKLKSATSYGGWSSFTYTTSGATFTATDATVTLDNTQSFDIEFYVEDKLGYKSEVVTIASGEPILYVDAQKRAVAVNKFAEGYGALEVNGDISIKKSPYTEGNQGKIRFDSDFPQGVQLRYNSYDSTKAPFGLHLERTPENTQTGSEPYLKVDGDIVGATLTANEVRLTDSGGHTRAFMQTVGTDPNNNGSGLKLGSGGGTIIGGGEAHHNYATGWGENNVATLEELVLTADQSVWVATNMQNGYTSRKEWEFGTDGYLRHPRYKYPNGYNMLSVRDGTHVSEDLFMIQNIVASVTFSSQSSNYTDVTFPAVFSVSPIWILATPVNSSSFGFAASIYSPTTTGCRVYLRHLDGHSTSYGGAVYTGTIQVQIVACGKKI